jgi:type VI secretion system protein ImpC
MSDDDVPRQLPNVNPPRVSITYDLQIGDEIEKRELAFVAGVLADLSGHPAQPLPQLRQRRFVDVNQHNFDKVLAAIGPRLAITVPNRLASSPADLPAELRFRSMEDFAPDRVATQIEPLSQLLDLRHRLVTLRSLRSETVHDSEILRALDTELLQGKESLSGVDRATIDARIAQIDDILSAQLNDVLHDPEFQRLEAAWRGLHYLVFRTQISPRLKVRVLNVSKRDLSRDCRMAAEFDQTALFKKVFEEECGTLGGQPFAVLIGDYEFGPQPEDMDVLETTAQIAAAAQAPFIAAASPKMFGMEAFTELGQPRALAKIFYDPIYERWNTFRISEPARFVGLVLPRMLLRLPFGRDIQPARAFDYDEGVDGTDHRKYLWGNAAYALCARLTSAFAAYGWCAAFRGVEGGGLVPGLPVHTFITDNGEVAMKCPTEVAIMERLDYELERLGFIPLLYFKGTDSAVFFSAPSCFKPRVHPSDAENVDGRLRVDLRYTMAVARFAHYLRCIGRDKIGEFQSREARVAFLNSWISQYVLPHEAQGVALAARFPLREARVELIETQGDTNCFMVILHALPLFQLEELSAPAKVVLTLPQ